MVKCQESHGHDGTGVSTAQTAHGPKARSRGSTDRSDEDLGSMRQRIRSALPMHPAKPEPGSIRGRLGKVKHKTSGIRKKQGAATRMD